MRCALLERLLQPFWQGLAASAQALQCVDGALGFALQLREPLQRTLQAAGAGGIDSRTVPQGVQLQHQRAQLQNAQTVVQDGRIGRAAALAFV